MDLSPQHPAGGTVLVLGRRNAQSEPGGWIEHGLSHTQRLEDMLRAICIERLTGNTAHNFAESFVIDVAVDEAGAWRHDRRFGDDLLHRRPVARPFRFQIEIAAEPGIVRHQLPYGDQVLAVRPELGPVLRHGIFQAELALLDKLHHSRRGRDNLGERRDIEEGRNNHRQLSWDERAVSESSAVDDSACVANHDHGAGTLAFLHRLLNGCGDQGQPSRSYRCGRARPPRGVPGGALLTRLRGSTGSQTEQQAAQQQHNQPFQKRLLDSNVLEVDTTGEKRCGNARRHAGLKRLLWRRSSDRCNNLALSRGTIM